MEHTIQSSLISAATIWQDTPGPLPRGKYPEWSLDNSDRKSMLVFATDPSGIPADQYRTVAKKLASSRGMGHRLLITSPGPQDGKTTSAANLAWSLSERGDSVLLMELDLRRPRFGEIFGISPARTGLESVLRGDARPEDAVFRVAGTTLHVAAVGEPQETAATLLQTHHLRNALIWAQEHFDWLLFDVPPVLPVSDVVELTSHCDAVLMVVRARATNASLVRKAIQTLGESLRFVIINDSNVNVSNSSKYFGNYEIAAK